MADGQGASPVHLIINSTAMVQKARRVAGQAARAERAIKAAHTTMAEHLQEYIAVALETAVDEHGRAQRQKPESRRLATALRSPRNRKVDSTGYTVGYLDDIAAVRPYWRGLEVGTYKHVGRFVPGVFVDASGVPQPLGESRNDLVKIRRRSPALIAAVNEAGAVEGGRARRGRRRQGGFRITRPIVGYHYFETGIRRFVAAGWTREQALATYVSKLEGAGLGELASTLKVGQLKIQRVEVGLNEGPLLPDEE
jgi:hypothetical protein